MSFRKIYAYEENFKPICLEITQMLQRENIEKIQIWNLAIIGTHVIFKKVPFLTRPQFCIAPLPRWGLRCDGPLRTDVHKE